MKKKLWILAFLLVAVGIIGLAFNKFDLNDNQLISFQKSWDIQSDELNELLIDGNSSDVHIEFIESSNDTAQISISGKAEPLVAERIDHTVISDGALALDLNTASKIRLLQFNFSEPKITVQVSLPKTESLDKLQVTVSSGNTKVSDASVNQLAVKSNSGEITLDNVLAADSELISQSGNLKVENITSQLTAATGSGDIKIKGLGGELTADTKSGNITVVQMDAANAAVTTSSGDVKFTAASDFNGFYDVRSNSGDIKVPDNTGTTQDIIKIKTGSGNITVKKQ